MMKFPSIGQFRETIRAVTDRTRYVSGGGDEEVVFDHTRSLPTLRFNGTVKLHGTNAGIVWHKDDDHPQFQSRERVLSQTADNAGFYKWGQENLVDLEEMLLDIDRFFKDNWGGDFSETIAVYGEWCGQGVQSKVAISELAKMFVIFAVKLDDVWQDISKLRLAKGSYVPENVHVITEFPTWSIDIDFENPALAQNKMITLTEQVEAECPVGKAFGVSGVGEGIVWRPAEPAWNDSRFWFKVKGEKHQSSKVKTLAPIDVEALAKVEAFVTYAVTESRLEQGLNNLINEQLKPFEMKSLGDFIRWVVNDIQKEESDVMIENGFDQKKVNPAISNAARKWYINKLNAG